MTLEVLAEIEAEYPIIKPCPFCGGVSSPNSNWNYAWVECDICGAVGPMVHMPYDQRKQAYIIAIEKWERRYDTLCCA